MLVISKEEMRKLIHKYPNGGIVFAEYRDDIVGDVMVTNGEFGATDVVPHHGEIYNWDWDIKECDSDDQFVVFDNIDILQMIQTLTKGLALEQDLEWNGDVY